MRSVNYAWIASGTLTVLALVFGLAFGEGHGHGAQTPGPETEVAAPQPASTPPRMTSSMSPPIVQLSETIEKLDSKVKELREAVARRQRPRGR